LVCGAVRLRAGEQDHCGISGQQHYTLSGSPGSNLAPSKQVLHDRIVQAIAGATWKRPTHSMCGDGHNKIYCRTPASSSEVMEWRTACEKSTPLATEAEPVERRGRKNCITAEVQHCKWMRWQM